MRTVRCVMCARQRPRRKTWPRMEDGARVHICRESRPCQVAYHQREVRWARRLLSLAPLGAATRAFKARHERMLAKWRRVP